MKKLVASFAMATTLTLSACVSTPPLSSLQRRALQTRSFEDTTQENVFRAFKSVLQDDGYIIKNQDMTGGLLVAALQKSDPNAAFSAVFNNNQNYRTGYSYELSISLEKVGAASVESRLTIQQIENYSHGGVDGHEVLDENTYRSFYDKVKLEVERRKAFGKK